MLSEAIEYPTQDDDWVTTVLIGGGINIVAAFVAFFGVFLFVIPLLGLVLGPLALLVAMLIPLPVAGYLVSVSRAVLGGEDQPPQFEDWGELFVDGAKVIVLVLVYSIPWVLIGVFWLIGFAIGGALGNDAGGVVILLFSLLAGLVGFVYLFVFWVLFPISFVNFARTDRLGGAFDIDALRRVATDMEYLKAWAIGALVLFFANFAANSIPLLGLFVVFYAQVVAIYVFTRGAAAPLGVDLETAGAGKDESLEAFASSEDDGEDGDGQGGDDKGQSGDDEGQGEDGDSGD